MNFSGITNTGTIGKLLRLPLHLIPKGMPIPIVQGRLKGKFWVIGASTHGCWLGSYEYEKQHLFRQLIMPGSVVFDIGANVGFYTLLASVLVGRQGRVVAFEPLPRNLSYLRKHLALNHIENVKVVGDAVADKAGTVTFDTGGNPSMGRINSGGSFQVNTIALDEQIDLGHLPKPNFMKIDVEGAELLVFKGAKSLLEQSHPTIFLATHGVEVHAQCCELLHSLGYHLRSVDERPLDKTDEILATYQ